MDQRVRALRGAITVGKDDKEEVSSATARLLEQMLERNGVGHDDLVSIVFTATPDISSDFPAAAARNIGISDIPLLCATEMNVRGAIPRCIRVLMHVYTNKGKEELRHVYLEDARQLRTDLKE